MARFEQRITESEVSAARKAIAAGASLRSVAAKIPCAPSTLSVRLKKAMADKADGEVGVRTNGSGEHDAGHTAAKPLEILRSALLATKTNGEPHWPTRLAAVRMLATLRPEEFDGSKGEQRKEPEIVVFDLEPSAVPVLHRPRQQHETPVSSEDAHPPLHETPSPVHLFMHQTSDGESVSVGTWSPPRPDDAITVAVRFHMTDSAEEVERWQAELSAGTLPTGIEDAS
jgi:hypothetical protein